MEPENTPDVHEDTPGTAYSGAPVPAPGGPRGRPYKRSPEAAQRIEAALVGGATYALAAAYGGISPDTLTRWRRG